MTLECAEEQEEQQEKGVSEKNRNISKVFQNVQYFRIGRVIGLSHTGGRGKKLLVQYDHHELLRRVGNSGCTSIQI